MTLGDFLLDAIGRPMVYGVRDCTLFPADWAMTWGLGDPAAAWRGRYTDKAGAERLAFEAGGIDALWDSGLGSIGIKRVDSPRTGDVGLVWMRNGQEMFLHGGIFNGARWAVQLEHGIGQVHADHAACWGPR